jgi:acetyl esterase/lipase
MNPTTLIASLLLSLATLQAAAPAPQKMALWEGDAPEGNGKTSAPVKCSLTLFRPEKALGPAVVICPGGGYGGLVLGGEGKGIAEWLNQHGITGLVLEYRLPAGRCWVPLLDAQQAIRLARQHATDWNIDPHKVGIIGFSAGGHLAATATTHFETKITGAPDSKISVRPDFSILVYPVVTMTELTHGGSKKNLLGANATPELCQEFSNELKVTDNTPPTFLAHAIDDKLVPIENSRLFYEAAKAHHVPTKLLELPNGGHGLNGYKGPSWDAWQKQSLEWLQEIKVL